MTLCEIQNDGLVLIYYLNNATRGNFIIPSQEETIPNLEILDQLGRKSRFWLSGTIQISRCSEHYTTSDSSVFLSRLLK